MGCGQSKGTVKAEGPSDITFKHIGVVSMDTFFRKAKEVLDKLDSITEPL
jgi:hypothetical protein